MNLSFSICRFTAFVLLLFDFSSNAATFPTWQSSRFTPAQLAVPAVSSATGNPDSDPFSNLAEYAFALEPFTANSSREALGLSLANPATAGMFFTYVQRKDATDLFYQIEYTDDLTNNLWNLLTNPQEPNAALDLGQVWQRSILVPPHYPGQKSPREFLRLRLHQKPNSSQPLVLNDPPQQFNLKLHDPFVDIDLRWIDRSNQETGYRIERRAANTSSWTYAGTTDYDARYFRDVHLGSDTLYHYRVRAVLYDGSFGAASNELTIRTPLDTDGDNLPDWFEIKIGTSTTNPDSDGDGLNDGYEVQSGTRSYGYADIGNGLPETPSVPIEDANGNPTGGYTSGTPGDSRFDPTNGDSDGNGINDGEEDWDIDGLTNAEEDELGTNPNKTDTDGDGKSDGDEMVPLDKFITLPRVPESRYAVIPVKKLTSDSSASFFMLNDEGAMAWQSGMQTVYFWKPGITPQQIAIPNASVKLVDLDKSGKVLLEGHLLQDPVTNGSEYAHDRKLNVMPATWTEADGLKTVSTILGKTLQQETLNRVQSFWASERSGHITRVDNAISAKEGEITEQDNILNNPNSSAQQKQQANLRKIDLTREIANCRDHRSHIPVTFDPDAFVLPGKVKSQGNSELKPLGFDAQGNVLASFGETLSIYGQDGVPFNLEWAQNSYVRWLPNGDVQVFDPLAVGGIHKMQRVGFSVDSHSQTSAPSDNSLMRNFQHMNQRGDIVGSYETTPEHMEWGIIQNGVTEVAPYNLSVNQITATKQDNQPFPILTGEYDYGVFTLYRKENSQWKEWKMGSLSDAELPTISDRLEIPLPDSLSLWRNGRKIELAPLVDTQQWELWYTMTISPNSGIMAGFFAKTTDDQGNAVAPEDQEWWIGLLAPYQFLTRDADTGRISSVDVSDSPSNPIPEVTMTLTNSTFTSDGKLQLTVTGTVEDRLSELIENPLNRVQKLDFKINGSVVDTINNLPSLSPGTGVMPWQPHKLEVAFTKTITVDHPENQTITLRAETSTNAAGNQGWASVAVTVGWENFVYTDPVEADPYSNGIHLAFTTSPTAQAVDSVKFYTGNRAPNATDTSLTETTSTSLLFNQSTHQLRINGPVEWAPTRINSFTGTLTTGSTTYIGTWYETALNSKIYVLDPVANTPALPAKKLVVQSATAEQSARGWLAPIIWKTPLPQEVVEQTTLKLKVNGAEQTLKPFVFSPQNYYVVAPDNQNRPQIFVITAETAQLPTALRLSPPNFTISQDGTDLEYKLKMGDVETVAASVRLYDGGITPTNPVPNTTQTTLDRGALLKFFGLLYKKLPDETDQPENVNFGLTIFHWFEEAGDLVIEPGVKGLVFHREPFDVSVVNGRMLIKIDSSLNPVDGSMALWTALSQAIAMRPFKAVFAAEAMNPANDYWAIGLSHQVGEAMMNSTAQEVNQLAQSGASIYTACMEVAAPGGQVVLTLRDALDGHFVMAAIGVIPFVHGGSAIIKNAAGETLATFTKNETRLLGLVKDLQKVANLRGKLQQRYLAMQEWGAAYKAGSVSSSTLKALVKEGVIPELSKSANRENARKFLEAMQAIPATIRVAECQHDLPLEFINFFLSHGLDPNDPQFLRWAERTEHNAWHSKGIPASGLGKFNDVWRAWIRSHENATYDEIIIKFQEMRSNYK